MALAKEKNDFAINFQLQREHEFLFFKSIIPYLFLSEAINYIHLLELLS